MSLSQLVRSALRARGGASIILTIAVGVGALTSAFGFADAAIWRQPPFAEAAGLVMINSTSQAAAQPLQRARWSYRRIQRLRQTASSFINLANYTVSTLTLTGIDEALRVDAEIVSPEYFPLLHTRAERGRMFVAADDAVGRAAPVVLVSHPLWARQFAADTAIIGRTIGVNGHALTVIGVMPENFRGLSDKAGLWIPTAVAPLLTYPEYLTTDQNFISVVARLKPGVTLSHASTEMRSVAAAVFAAEPIVDPDSGQVSSAVVRTLNDARTTPATRRSVLMLLGAIFLLHLLACTNVASLLLARSALRRREFAIRTALGATPFRLLPAVISDSILLVMLGGLLGTLLASGATLLLQMPADLWGTHGSNSGLASFANAQFDLRTLAFGVALTIMTVLLVAWIPATALLRIKVSDGLRDGARGFTGGAPTLQKPNLRGIIIAVEAAFAMLLLVTGGLMIDSFRRMQRTNLGIDASHLLTFDLRVPEAQVPAEAAPAYLAKILAAIAATPGVVAASVDGGAPVTGSASSTLYVAGRPLPGANDAPGVLRHYVGPDHFRTLGIPLITGRAFTAHDVAGQPRVVVISQSAARRFWRAESPIGQRVWFGGGSSFNSPQTSAEIVGIVGDVAYQPLDQHPFQADFYTPYMQFTYASRTVFVRTAGDPLAVTGAVRRAVHTVDRDAPLIDVQTMSAMIGKSWTRQRFDALLFGGFAVLALLLATTGIYAVVSYTINQRTREMGIRLALGATNFAVIRLVVREGMAFPLVGLVVGLGASVLLRSVIGASLYEVSPTDPRVLLQTAALLLLVSAIACLAPAVRAARVSPLVAMRD